MPSSPRRYIGNLGTIRQYGLISLGFGSSLWAWVLPVSASTIPPAPSALLTPAALVIPPLPTAPQDSVLGEAAQHLPAPVTPQYASHLVLRLSERQVYLYDGATILAQYPVAVGRAGWQTPTGRFTVQRKQADPIWRHPFTGELVPPGPENPLGRHWIGFWSDGSNAIGFHGTPQESLIGQAVSHGCVRMRNADVAMLFERVEVGTPVIVILE